MSSITNYVADGSTNQFQIPFTYISQLHVVVTVDGVSVTPTFINDTQLSVSSTPASGAAVIVKRVTPVGALVDFTDGSTLFESDLDLAHQQNRFIAEESRDRADAATATVNTNIANINIVAADTTAVNTVAGNTTNINTVAADGTDIGLVAGSITSVNTVSGDITNVNTNAANITAIQGAAGNAATATTKASEAEAARDAAIAAKNAAEAVDVITNATATASTLSAGSPATASVTATNGTGAFSFGIPAGAQGTQGIQGIQGIQGVAGVGDLLAANNLSDLNNASTARTNLGLGTAATTASTAYATATQGTTADSAVQPNDSPTFGSVTADGITVDNTNPIIKSADADGFLNLSGGTTGSNGGHIRLYGESHATGANDILFRSNSSAVLHYNASIPAWNFLSKDILTSGSVTAASFTGDGSALTGLPAGYTNANVDTHLNKSTAATGEVLSWSGTDYDWIAAGGGSPDLYADSANGSAVTPTANAGNSYNSVAIGNGADIGSGRGDSIAIGTDALANQSQALAIGRSATVNSSGTWGTAVGRNSVVNGQSAVALGNSYSSGTDSLAAVIDNNSSTYGATGANSITLGRLAKASNTGGNAIGWGATSTHEYSSAFGVNATTTNSHQVALGGSGYTVLVSGAYKFPTADGSANQVLQTNGSGVLSFATAGGGGGSPDLFAENYDGTSTQPVATGTNAAAVGLAYSSGNNSFSASIADSTATYGAQGNFAQAIGYHAKSTGSIGLSVGPCISSGSFNSYALGSFSEATQNYSWGLGRYAKSDIIGKMAYTAMRVTNTTGSSQQGTYVLMGETTNATQKLLTTDKNAASTSSRNVLLLAPSSAVTFTGLLVAREAGATGDLCASWKIDGFARSLANGAVSLIRESYTVLENTPGWTFDAYAFNNSPTHRGVHFSVNGHATKTIYWVLTLTTSEVITV
jgi:hypothetical protein